MSHAVDPVSFLCCSDIGLHVGKNFVDSFPQRVYVSSIFPMLVEAKRLGEKSGSGFYKVCVRICLNFVCNPIATISHRCRLCTALVLLWHSLVLLQSGADHPSIIAATLCSSPLTAVLLPSCQQFDAKRRASPDPAVEPFVKRSIESAGLLGKIFGGKPPKFSQQVSCDNCFVVVDLAAVFYDRFIGLKCLVVPCCVSWAAQQDLWGQAAQVQPAGEELPVVGQSVVNLMLWQVPLLLCAWCNIVLCMLLPHKHVSCIQLTVFKRCVCGPLQEMIELLFFPVVNEGCRVIDEGIVDKPADLDVATVMAMGFPPYRYAAFVL
jgi:hypothetical protein